jgi:predicted transposase/invertase (TIGR01784 family)
MTQRYLDPTNDVSFKKIFSDKHRLMDFLNAILRLEEGHKIVELTFIPTEEVPDIGQGKRSLFDLKVQDQSGMWYVIEMQSRREPHYLKRIQYYGSHSYVSQLKNGERYPSLLPVVVISVLKKSIFPTNIGVISYHRTLEDKTFEQHLFALSYVFVELSKFTKSEGELQSVEDEWLYFLNSAQETKGAPASITDPYVLEAFEAMEKFNWNEAEYDAYVRARLLIETEEATQEERFLEGQSVGLEKGVAIGIEKGREEGKLEIAKAMLTKGMDIQMVSDLTGLPIECLALMNIV